MKKILYTIIACYAFVILVNNSFSDRVDIGKASGNHSKRFEHQEEAEEGKSDEPSVYLRYHEGIRTRDHEKRPSYDAGYKWKELSLAQKNARLKANKRTKSNQVKAWHQRGPANVPGRTRALLNIPGDPTQNTWLAGAATGGIWRTTDGGLTWSDRNADLPALPISSFASNRDGTVIYAGSGEHVSSFASAIGNGIYKSTDKGLTWTQLPSTNLNADFSVITRLITNPDNPDIIIVSTAPYILAKQNTSSIFRSTDGGLTWVKVKQTMGVFEQVIANPKNFNEQYASEHGVGVWKSNDAGVTWSLSNNGMKPTGRIEISVSSTTGSTLFASAEGNLSGRGSDLYFSSNGGLTWSLVDVRFNNSAVDFLEGQGYYDNTILCDPFVATRVYVGGVSLFRVTLGSGTSNVSYYRINEVDTDNYMVLQSFAGITHENGKLDVGSNAGSTKVEVRFGPGKSQKAHRFLIPPDKTNGLTPTDFTYQNYIDVPFEVWDVTNNRQLMVSFRDQNRNGKFDLITEYLTNSGIDYLLNSREYIYISDVNYTTVPTPQIATTGGHLYRMMYNFFPALKSGVMWDPQNIPLSKLIIERANITRLNATTVTVADGRGGFDGKNRPNQVDPTKGVHVDHHCLIPLIDNSSSKTFRLLLGNDGGVFMSKSSIVPGVTEGDWEFRSFGMITTQLYGADKVPGKQQYIFASQDNGTRVSQENLSTPSVLDYRFATDGDGFACNWNSKNPSLALTTKYYGTILKSRNDGVSWSEVMETDNGEFPFITKLANSTDYPDRVFTVGAKGVYVSENYGDTWQLTPINSNFVIGSPMYLDVEVSRANSNIVWAGSGMNSTETVRNLFVSEDAGKTFSPTNNFNLTALGNITSLATHPTEQHTAYALFSFAKGPKILRTTNLGESWEDISGFGSGTTSDNGFPDVAVFCLYVRPDDPDIIWAGTEIGIVESLDAGQTWALTNDFPRVAVWDMKGLDKEVIIATHGRGLWVAEIEQQQVAVPTPEIIASGTSPSGEFLVRIDANSNLDSVQIVANNTRLISLKNVSPGNRDIILSVAAGTYELKLIGFAGNIPFQSLIHQTEFVTLRPPAPFYTTFLSSTEQLQLQNLTLQTLTGPIKPGKISLQSDHNYKSSKVYSVLVKIPVHFSGVNPVIYLKDIAIVEPVKDKIVVEATNNGLDWTELASYDAALNSTWQNIFDSKGNAENDMFLEHSVDMSGKFVENELILCRARLVSDDNITAWGWAIEYISIQQIPTSIADPVVNRSLEIFPNPVQNQFTITYQLRKPEHVSVSIIDVFGRNIYTINRGLQDTGKNSIPVDMSNESRGTFIVLLKTANETTVKKITVVD